MHTDKTKAKFILLRSEGWSISRIAKHIDISRPTLIKWNEEFHFAIRSFRAVELEALQHSILEKHQEDLAHLAKQQTAIAKELSKRKLADVPTEKLFRIDSLLREEIAKTRAAALLIHEESTSMPQPEHPMQHYLAHANSAQAKTNGAASALPRADNDDSNSNEKSDMSNSPDPENPQSQPVNTEPSRFDV